MVLRDLCSPRKKWSYNLRFQLQMKLTFLIASEVLYLQIKSTSQMNRVKITIRAACGKMVKLMMINRCWWKSQCLVSTRQPLDTKTLVKLKVETTTQITSKKTSLEMQVGILLHRVKTATSLRKVSYEKWRRSRTRSSSHLKVSCSLLEVDSISSWKRILTSPVVKVMHY